MSTPTRKLALFLVVILAAVIWVLWPGSVIFDSLSLRGKLVLYRVRRSVGFPMSTIDLAAISWYGQPAADAVTDDLEHGSGIARVDAARIVEDVQSRGCDLRGSRSEVALRHILDTQQLSDRERVSVLAALKTIDEQLIAPLGAVDGRTDGPCERARTTRSK